MKKKCSECGWCKNGGGCDCDFINSVENIGRWEYHERGMEDSVLGSWDRVTEDYIYGDDRILKVNTVSGTRLR